eukprot:4478-Prymnesium_polylepis.1
MATEERPRHHGLVTHGRAYRSLSRSRGAAFYLLYIPLDAEVTRSHPTPTYSCGNMGGGVWTS